MIKDRTVLVEFILSALSVNQWQKCVQQYFKAMFATDRKIEFKTSILNLNFNSQYCKQDKLMRLLRNCSLNDGLIVFNKSITSSVESERCL